MTHSYGQRSGTRYKFARPFKGHGMPLPHTYLTTYRRGELVTIMGNGAIQKGMPHSFYHGRTGRIYDITKTSLGVEVHKRVGNRKVLKRIHIRREHVRKSRSQEEFHKRRMANDAAALERAKSGKKETVCQKRSNRGPEEAKTVIQPTIVDFSPIPFVEKF